MHTLVFVYGTLKEGFANFHISGGIRRQGEYETVRRFPLYVIGEYYIPWLVDQEDEGNQVKGQVFEADSAALIRMDELEMLGEPGWFTRRQILVRPTDSKLSGMLTAYVYFGATARLNYETVHLGPIGHFSPVHDIEYRKRAA